MQQVKPLLLCAALSALSPTALALASTLVGSGYTQPVFLAAPAGDARLFIVEKDGLIKVQQGGLVSNFLDLRGKVDPGGEGGLIGLAFDPGYAQNGRFYVHYTSNSGAARVEIYTAPNPAGNSADPDSGELIISIPSNGRGNHKAGWIGFSPSDPGQLYIATGDSGGSNDPDQRAQSLDTLLGKMLRITPLPSGGYTVPADNPFVGAPGLDEIWAYGLRNPYRNSFDRQSGDFWIADVGQSAREEINLALAGSEGGQNYGWRAREGRIDNPGVGDAAPVNAVDPIFDYPRAIGGSVIGGYVVRNSVEDELNGLYLFGDFVSGRLFTLDAAAPDASFTDRTSAFGTPFGAFQLSSFGEDGFGGVYAVGLNGNIYQLAAAVPEPGSWALFGLGLLALALRRR